MEVMINNKRIERRPLCGGTGKCATCNVRTVCRTVGKVDLIKGEIQLPEDVLWGEISDTEETELSEFGVAFDIGTTAMAAMLWDMGRQERKPLASCSAKNPLTVFGPDVISRIEYANRDHERISEMRSMLTEQMERMIGELAAVVKDSEAWTEGAGHKEKAVTICRIAAVGNPTMMHFLFGKDPSGLAKAPFRGEELPLEIDVKTVGLGSEIGADGKTVDEPKSWILTEDARLRTLPVMGGHLGADAAAVMLALRLPENQRPTMAIDIGTNGELILTDGMGNLWGCSTAAGPAFEGGSVTPGSKFIETAAVMLSQGWLNEEGSITGHPLLTQTDIRQLQMAKGAVAAGAEILMKLAGLGTVGKIWLAGTFGNHLKPESAVKIGLLPDLANIIGCGNAAGVGASLILLSDREWDRGCRWAGILKHVELAEEPQFTDVFLKHMYFPGE